MSAAILAPAPQRLGMGRGSTLGAAGRPTAPLLRVRRSLPRPTASSVVVAQAQSKSEDPILEDPCTSAPGPVRKWINQTLKVGVAVGVACALALTTPDVAEAGRSGGRIGGSAFGAARSMGGMGGMGSRGMGGSTLGGSTMRSSRAFTPSQAATAPNVVIAPSYGFGGYGYGRPMMPFFSPFAFMGFFNIAVMAIIALTAIQMFQNMFGGEEEMDDDIQVVTVQVGLLGLARDLQDDLDQLAETVDFDSPEGLHTLLQETTLALMRNPDYCIYGTSSAAGTDNYDDAEDLFNEASMTERSKFSSETLVSVAGRSGVQKSDGKGRGDGGMNEMIVVTVIVAAESRIDIPEVNSIPTLKAALSKIGGLRPDGILAAEVLWTPQEKGDFLTKDEVMVDYPGMRLL